MKRVALIFFTGFLGFLLGLASTQGVRAQGTDTRALAREAQAEFQAGRWAEARALLLQLFESRPSGEALRLLGAASYELRDYVAAVAYFERALAFSERPLSDAGRAEAERGLAAAARFVGTLSLEITPTASGAGASVSVDGGDPQPAGESVVVSVGAHTLEVTAAGFAPTQATVDIVGGPQRLELELIPLEPEAEAEADIEAEPPPELARPEPPMTESPATEASELSLPQDEPATARGPAIPWLVTGSALAVGSVISGLWYRDRRVEYAECPCVNNGPRIRRERNATLGLTVGFAALAIPALTLGVLRLRRAPDAEVSVSLRGGRLSLEGSF